MTIIRHIYLEWLQTVFLFMNVKSDWMKSESNKGGMKNKKNKTSKIKVTYLIK